MRPPCDGDPELRRERGIRRAPRQRLSADRGHAAGSSRSPADGDFHPQSYHELPIANHRLLLRRTHRQDCSLTRIDDCSETLDIEHSHIRNTESSSDEVGCTRATCPCPLHCGASLEDEVFEWKQVGISHDRNEKTVLDRRDNSDIDRFRTAITVNHIEDTGVE